MDAIRPDERVRRPAEPPFAQRVDEDRPDRRRLATQVIAEREAASRRAPALPDRGDDHQHGVRERSMQPVDHRVCRLAGRRRRPAGIVMTACDEHDVGFLPDRG